jgi:diaminopimelate epimerase
MISNFGQPSAQPFPSSRRGGSLAGRRVSRMNGAGNKILVLDLRGGATLPTPAEARAIHRAPGLDYDQLMVLSDPRDRQTLAHVTIYNNDGSLAGACGNGTRCVADRLVRQTGLDSIVVETAAGLITCERLGPWTYRIDMGRPRLAWNEIPLAHPVADTREVDVPLDGAGFGAASVVNMGNPHAVFFVGDVAAIDLERWGPRYETHPLFPEKANISFAEVKARDRIALHVWERGVGATLACGSAACAALVSAVRRGLTDRTANVALPGGELVITSRESDGHVLMTGPVEFEREVVLEAEMFSFLTKDAAP